MWKTPQVFRDKGDDLEVKYNMRNVALNVLSGLRKTQYGILDIKKKEQIILAGTRAEFRKIL